MVELFELAARSLRRVFSLKDSNDLLSRSEKAACGLVAEKPHAIMLQPRMMEE